MNAHNDKSNRLKNLCLARGLAFEKLKVMDSSKVSRHAGGILRENDEGKTLILIDYLGKPLCIDIPAMTVTWEPDDWKGLGGAIRLGEEIFILHYLVQASGTSTTGNFIPFRSMNGGMTYESIFKARTIDRLLMAFRGCEEALLDTGSTFGGTPYDPGNISLRLKVLPHVDLVLMIWKGDDEIPSSGNILFDESVLNYLSTEDCVVMAETMIDRIIRVLNKNSSKKAGITKDKKIKKASK